MMSMDAFFHSVLFATDYTTIEMVNPFMIWAFAKLLIRYLLEKMPRFQDIYRNVRMTAIAKGLSN